MVRQYRYLLRTAPPDALEEAHIEALGQLGQAQRRLLLDAIQASQGAAQRLRSTVTEARLHPIGAHEAPPRLPTVSGLRPLSRSL